MTDFVKAMDEILTQAGFRKVADLSEDQLNKDICENCVESSGTTCVATAQGEIVLWEGFQPLMGAIAIYIEYEAAGGVLEDPSAPISVDIEVVAESQTGQIVLHREKWTGVTV